MSHKPDHEGRGPFRAENVTEGSHYELSRGHALYFGPTGGRGSGPNLVGAAVVGFDPAVSEAGVDTGYSPEPGTLRAPDVAVGNVPDTPGWVQGAPALAIEYADVGQDEDELADKIRDLLDAGTRWVWVVRLAGPRRVEVHAPGEPLRALSAGEELTAPGVLKNPVRVEALYDRKVAEEALLRNLLQRQGYETLDAVLEQGHEQGREQGRVAEARLAIVRVLARRGIAVSPSQTESISKCNDIEQLERWLDAAVTASDAQEVFSGG